MVPAIAPPSLIEGADDVRQNLLIYIPLFLFFCRFLYRRNSPELEKEESKSPEMERRRRFEWEMDEEVAIFSPLTAAAGLVGVAQE